MLLTNLSSNQKKPFFKRRKAFVLSNYFIPLFSTTFKATPTIGERNGDGFPGMEINRTFKVVNIMSEDNAITVNYDGNKTICELNN